MTEKYLTLSELKEHLEKEQKEREELLNEQKLALEHAKKFSKLKVKDARKLVEELETMKNITDIMAIKITDILPTHIDDMQALFAKERTILTNEEMEKVLEIVRKYL